MVCDQAAGARCESTGAVKTDCICTESSRKIAAKLEERLDDDTESIITNERYEAITYVVEKCVKKPKKTLDFR